MNTAYKMYNYTGLAAEFYSNSKTESKSELSDTDNVQATAEKTNEYETNFLNLPKGFKIGG